MPGQVGLPTPPADDDPVGETLDLFALRGDGRYGEVVDQRRHALQCATWAVDAGADDVLVAAALLHDVGHLLHRPGPGDAVDSSVDRHHEAVGARWVAPRFGAAVARVIALHVLAKRYRCTVDPAYRALLSPASIRTLSAQGGLLDAAESARVVAHPGFDEAMALRFWDEKAKDPEAVTTGINEFVAVLARLVVSTGRDGLMVSGTTKPPGPRSRPAPTGAGPLRRCWRW